MTTKRVAGLVLAATAMAFANSAPGAGAPFTETWEDPALPSGQESSGLPAPWEAFSLAGSIFIFHPATTAVFNQVEPLAAPASGDQYLRLHGTNTGVYRMTGEVITADMIYTLAAAVGNDQAAGSGGFNPWSLQLWADTSGNGAFEGTAGGDTFIGQQFATNPGATIAATGEWASNSFSFDADQTPALLGVQLVVFLNNYGENFSYYDNVSFSASPDVDTPEPATLALFGAGLAALGVLRRRRVLGLLAAPIALGMALVAQTAQAAPVFSVLELGGIGGNESYGTALSANGMATGYGETVSGTHAWLFTGSGPLVDLGTLGGTSSDGTAVNNSGQVTGGAYTTGDSGFNAFLSASGGPMADLGTFGGGSSYGRAINAAGQVTGYASAAGGAAQAFLSNNGGPLIGLGTLGGTFASGEAINAGGQVTGYAYTAGNAAYHAFLSNNGAPMVDLGTLGGARSSGEDINDLGQVTGSAMTAANQTHAFLSNNGGPMIDLGTLGGASSFGVAINGVGQVTGSADLAGAGGRHAFVSDGTGPMIDLGKLAGTESSRGQAINDLGWVVGISIYENTDSTAFLWTPQDGMIDLEAVVQAAYPGLSSARVYDAIGTNNAGQILVQAYDPNQILFEPFPLLLTLTGFTDPNDAPEPATLALLGFGLAGLALARRRR